MRLRWLFLDWWKYFLGFLVILEETRIRILEFGRAWKARTQDWRKSMFFTWIMNSSVFWRFIDCMSPCITFTSHIWPSPEIWFETEHFEFFSFWAPSSVSGLFTKWDENHSRGQTKWNLTNSWVYLISTRRYEQNPEIVSKSEDFDFLAKFCQNSVFVKIEVIFFWHSEKMLR